MTRFGVTLFCGVSSLSFGTGMLAGIFGCFLERLGLACLGLVQLERIWLVCLGCQWLLMWLGNLQAAFPCEAWSQAA